MLLIEEVQVIVASPCIDVQLIVRFECFDAVHCVQLLIEFEILLRENGLVKFERVLRQWLER